VALYQTAEGKWGVDFRDEWGARHRKPVGSREAAAAVEAELKEQALKNKAALAHYQRGEQFSLTEARDFYLAQVRGNENTKAHMRDRLAQFEKHLGQTALAAVTPRLLAQWIESRKQTLSPQTLWRDVKMLRAWGDFLKRENYLVSNPFATLQVEKPTETTARALSYIEEAELLRSFEARTLLRVLLALDAGLATQEIQRLRRNHLDLAQQTLTSWRHKTKRTRTIPLTRRLLAALECAGAKLAPDTLINSRSGKELTAKGTTAFLHKARGRLSFHFRFHDLRHTFATRLAAVASPFVVAELLGHALPRWSFNDQGQPLLTTTRYYVHPSPQELRAAVNAMQTANPNLAS
jgi:integrase